MRDAIYDLVKRISGGNEKLAGICVRAIQARGDEDERDEDESDSGDVCCRVTPEEIAILDSAPQIVAAVDADSDPDKVDVPFVRCGNLLYARRSWRYEQIVRRRVGEMAASEWLKDNAVPEGGEYATLRKEDQRPSVPTLLAKRFSILTGGPGTGKTFTLGKAVKLLREKRPDAIVALAAPTGKAAARINESLEDLKKQGLLDGVQPATTLHSLLEPNPDFVTFRHDRSNPLPLDWLVVDEASMIALPLMAKLVEALPETCALTLIGDAHQLASVEQGRVFGDLCELFAGNVARLTVSSRFPAGGTIDRLAKAVNGGGEDSFDKVAGILAEGSVAIFRQIAEEDAFEPDKWGDFRDLVQNGFALFKACTEPETALEELKRFRILCAHRKGPFGVEALNRYVEGVVGKQCPRPMMITRNDKMLEVNNGDVGVVMPKDPQYLCLKTLGHGVRKIRLELLPATELAFASTVHKAQGSEYGDVAIVLPQSAGKSEEENAFKLLTREILYTAITRTKKTVAIWGSDDAIRHCSQHAIDRVSGLVP